MSLSSWPFCKCCTTPETQGHKLSSLPAQQKEQQREMESEADSAVLSTVHGNIIKTSMWKLQEWVCVNSWGEPLGIIQEGMSRGEHQDHLLNPSLPWEEALWLGEGGLRRQVSSLLADVKAVTGMGLRRAFFLLPRDTVFVSVQGGPTEIRQVKRKRCCWLLSPLTVGGFSPLPHSSYSPKWRLAANLLGTFCLSLLGHYLLIKDILSVEIWNVLSDPWIEYLGKTRGRTVNLLYFF